MKNKTKLCLLFLCCSIAVQSRAQFKLADSNKIVQKPVPPHPVIKKPKPIRTEISGGIRLATNGWGIFVDKGWVQSDEKQSDQFYDIKLAQIELEEKKHPKEVKRTNNYGSQGGENSPKPFIYGKVNNFYALKVGYGKRKMIAGKPEHGTVSIHWVYVGGLSAGLLKPYYLDVQKNNATKVESIKYSDSTAEQFLGIPTNVDFNYIIGSSGFSKGLNEIKVIPGLHVKTALHFDFATSKATVLAVETGVNAELYMKNIELMATAKATPYLVNMYASFQFGKRKQ